MKSIVNTIIILGVIACMVCSVMLYDWTGLRIGGLFVIPATALLFLLLKRVDNLPKWINL